MNPENRQNLVSPAIVLAAVVLASYAVALGGGFVWDDRPLIVENSQVHEPARWLDNFTASFWETGDKHDRFRNFFRPLVMLSYGVDHAIWGLRPFGFHLTNLLLHFACSLLVYRIAADRLPRRGFALLAAAVFAAHPVHVESVAWVSGRTDLLSCLFMLSAFTLHRSRRAAVRATSWLLFAAALFSKEMAATLPLLVGLDRWLAAGPREGRFRDALRHTLPYVAVLGVNAVARHAVLGSPGPSLFELTPLAWLATACFAVGRYLTLLILPVGLDAHYPYRTLEGFSAAAWIGAGMLVLVTATAWRSRRRHPETAFWIAWVPVALLPVMAFGRFGDVIMADRFLYIPSVGVALLAGIFASKLAVVLASSRLRRAAAAVAAVLVVVLAGAAASRSRVWKSDFTLFGDMVTTSPGSALVHSNLGTALYHRGEFESAVESFRTAIALNPEFAMAHNNLAAAYERSDRLEEAIVAYNRALTLAPGLLEAKANAGNLLVRLGYADRGLPLLDELARSHPEYVPGLHALGDALHRLGRPDDARPVLERILRIDPDYAPAHYLIGEIHMLQRRPVEAAAALHRFLELWKDEGEHAAAARRRLAEIELGS